MKLMYVCIYDNKKLTCRTQSVKLTVRLHQILQVPKVAHDAVVLEFLKVREEKAEESRNTI